MADILKVVIRCRLTSREGSPLPPRPNPRMCYEILKFAPVLKWFDSCLPDTWVCASYALCADAGAWVAHVCRICGTNASWHLDRQPVQPDTCAPSLVVLHARNPDRVWGSRGGCWICHRPHAHDTQPICPHPPVDRHLHHHIHRLPGIALVLSMFQMAATGAMQHARCPT